MISKAKAGLAMVGVAAAIGFAAPALAQDAGFYIGGHFGQSDISGACDGLPAGVSCDEKDSAWKILGGYQFNRNLALELGYANLGEASASGGGVTASVEVAAWDLVAVGTLPLADKFSAYGKLGLYRSEADLTSNIGVSESESESGLTFGIGLRYDFTRNLGVRVEWQRYNEVAEDTDVNMVSVGILWKF